MANAILHRKVGGEGVGTGSYKKYIMDVDKSFSARDILFNLCFQKKNQLAETILRAHTKINLPKQCLEHPKKKLMVFFSLKS